LVSCFPPCHSEQSEESSYFYKPAFNDDKSSAAFPSETSLPGSLEVAGCFAPLNSPPDESAVADMTATGYAEISGGRLTVEENV
jgi:hypothetical protein